MIICRSNMWTEWDFGTPTFC